MGSLCPTNEENSNDDTKESTKNLTIATWNVHDWADGDRNPNINRVISALSSHSVDVIGFQEAQYRALRQRDDHDFSKQNGYHQDTLKLLRQKLDFRATSDQIMNRKFYSGVIMATKYKIIKTYMHKSDRIQLNIVAVNDKINIGVIVVHLDHRDEKVRIKEYQQMLQMIEDNDFIQLPLVLLGDFNALTKSDYDDERWNEIKEIRQNNKWELPMTDLTDMIKESKQFLDCLKIFEKNGDNKMKMEDISSCRYDTRIDYIFVNNRFLEQFQVLNVEHLAHNNCSDHKMVKVTFAFK